MNTKAKWAAGIVVVVIAIVAGWWALSERRAPAGTGVGGERDAEVVSTTTTSGSAGSGSSKSILPYNSGVTGMVLLGPTCPVERVPPEPQCADKPYATSIIVYRAGSNNPFVLGNSDAAGAFRFSLPPGEYELKATPEVKTLPRCALVSITVPPSSYATTTISCDTGIR